MSRVVTAMINGLKYFQDNDGYWKRQFNIPSSWAIDQISITVTSNVNTTFSTVPATPMMVQSFRSESNLSLLFPILPITIITIKYRMRITTQTSKREHLIN